MLTDRESAHPWIVRPELDGALVLPVNLPISDEEESDLLLALLTKFSVKGIHVHHNGWLYHRLPWFKAMDPTIRTVDSLHVIEWRTGGFVELAVKLSNAIDTHHVISPQLRDYMVLQRDVPKERVSLAPLYGLSEVETAPKAEKDPGRPFTVSFVGRLSQQKRPYLFLRYAAQLRRSTEQDVRFILHGSGALAEETSRLIAKYGLSDCLERREPPRSVDDTLADSDLLVISSDNEGLTLTTFEATAQDVAVLSTDVGSQASLVSDKALVPRQPLAFIRDAVERTKAIMASEELRKQIVRRTTAENRRSEGTPGSAGMDHSTLRRMESMTDQVAAVVVTYNRVDKLGRVLDSILAQSRPVDRLIVIDNASTDSTPQLLVCLRRRSPRGDCPLGFQHGRCRRFLCGYGTCLRARRRLGMDHGRRLLHRGNGP